MFKSKVLNADVVELPDLVAMQKGPSFTIEMFVCTQGSIENKDS